MKGLICIWMLGLCPVAIAAQSAATPPRSEPLPEKIDALFARYGDSTPGCALGVFNDGRVAYERGYGMADLNQSVPITPQTSFYIASTSKQFTAFAVALLVEQGKLSLTDTLAQHFPELPAWSRTITLDQLIHHASGLPDYLTLWAMSGRSVADEVPLEQALSLVARSKPNFAPGSAFGYSNSNYILLAELVRRVSGKSLREFARAAMFAPLGMEDTVFHDDARDIVPRRAEGYAPAGGAAYRIVRTSFALVGDGGLLTTVRDLQKWDENFYVNRLGGGEALIRRVTTRGVRSDGKELPYAFGLFPSKVRGAEVVQHGGNFIGFNAQLLRFPAEHLSVAVLCNDERANADAHAWQVAELFLGDRLVTESPMPLAGVNVPKEVALRNVGRYRFQPGVFLNIVPLGDGIGVQPPGAPAAEPLTATSESTFAAPGDPAVFRFGSDARGMPTLLVEGSDQAAPAPRLDPPPEMTDQFLEGYAGRFSSDSVDSWLHVRIRDRTVEIRRRYQSNWQRLQPVERDVYVRQGEEFHFRRGRDGITRALVLTTGRAAGIEFTRDIK
jgi:CubicO group peptidase (beta-lactamase class C family)